MTNVSMARPSASVVLRELQADWIGRYEKLRVKLECLQGNNCQWANRPGNIGYIG